MSDLENKICELLPMSEHIKNNKVPQQILGASEISSGQLIFFNEVEKYR